MLGFFSIYAITFGVLAVALGFVGLEFTTAVSGALTAVANGLFTPARASGILSCGETEMRAMGQMDAFGRHEVLHMSLFLAQCVEEQLLDHAQVQANPRWRELAERANDALLRLYQAIGAPDGPPTD